MFGCTPRFARAVRGHWSVENQCHWMLDVNLGEDQSRVRVGYAAENLGTLRRRLALNLLQREKTKKRGPRANRRTPDGITATCSSSWALRCVGPGGTGFIHCTRRLSNCIVQTVPK